MDLKPKNIFVENKDKILLKIGDFGSSKQSGKHSYHEEILGTHGFMAPEIIFKKPYKVQNADIFSLGCTFYYLLFFKECEIIMKNEKEVHKNIEIETEKLNFFNSKDIGKLIIKMLRLEPDERLETRDVLETLKEMKRDFLEGVQTSTPIKPLSEISTQLLNIKKENKYIEKLDEDKEKDEKISNLEFLYKKVMNENIHLIEQRHDDLEKIKNLETENKLLKEINSNFNNNDIVFNLD
jgi:serine/threonine protein kinase